MSSNIDMFLSIAGWRVSITGEVGSLVIQSAIISAVGFGMSRKATGARPRSQKQGHSQARQHSCATDKRIASSQAARGNLVRSGLRNKRFLPKRDDLPFEAMSSNAFE